MPTAVQALFLQQPPAVCRVRRAVPCCAARSASRGSLRCRATGEGKATERSSASASDSVRVAGLLSLDQICNEFVCNSSPAIESTLRQARTPPCTPCTRRAWHGHRDIVALTASSAQCARDIDNLREGEARSVAPFAEKVLYTDGLAARWMGRSHFSTHLPVSTLLKSARSVVNTMRMDGLDAAFIGWSLSGQTPAGPVSLVCRPTPTHEPHNC